MKAHTVMNRFALLIIFFIYYVVWAILPIFEQEGKWIIFPLPSIYAVYLPIVLLLGGFTIVGTFLGVLMLRGEPEERGERGGLK